MKEVEITFKEFEFGKLCFVVEKTLEGYQHPCTVYDVSSLIEKLPPQDLEGLALVVFHQPTRKEEMMSPRWAIFNPETTYGSIRGPAIFLEAVNPSVPLKWKTSLTPEDQKELEFLELEGHKLNREKRQILISMDIDSVRNTQLQRSFMHEIGHYVDYKRNPELFQRKTKTQKEDFANQYFSQIRDRI